MKHLLKSIAAAALLSTPVFAQNSGDWTADYTEDTSFAGTEVFTFQNPGPLQRRATFDNMADDISIYMDAPTFGNGAAASLALSFDLSGTDHSMTATSGLMSFSNDVEIGGNLSLTGTVSSGLDMGITSITSGDIVPTTDSTYDIGSTTERYANGWFDTITASTLNVTDFNADYVLYGQELLDLSAAEVIDWQAASGFYTADNNAGTSTITFSNVPAANYAVITVFVRAGASPSLTWSDVDVWQTSGGTAPVHPANEDHTYTFYVLNNVVVGASTIGVQSTDTWIIAASDEATALTTGTGKITFRAPYAATITEVRASVTTAPTDATLIVDINEAGTSIMTTDKLDILTTATIDDQTATVTDTAIAQWAEITVDIDQIGSTVAGAGLKVYITHTH